MPYIKSLEDDIRYNATLCPVYTQNGYKAMRFIGDSIPDTYTQGFKYYNDNGNVISDLSNYKYYYSPNVYAVSEDQIVNPKPNNTPSGGSTPAGGVALAQAVAKLREQVESMETYTETKSVYIDDTECTFNVDKTGAVQAQLTVNGVITPCQYSVNKNTITVTFDPLEEVGEVTIFIVQ